MEKIPAICSPACAEPRISASLSPCPTFAQAARWTGAPPQVGGGSIGPAAPCYCCPGPPQSFRGDGSKTKAANACRQAWGGEGWRTGWKKTEGRLPGDCDLGAGPREAKLAAVTERKIKALGPDSGGKKVLEEIKEQSRLPVCPHRVGHYLFCMTNRHKTIPEQHGALDMTRGTEGRAGVRGGAGAGLAGFVQGGTKDTRLPVLGNLCPLECGALGLGVLYCSPSSLGWVPGWRGWLGAALPQPLPPRATRRWRSTVCSASVLRRRWEDAAGSRGGPGPVGRQGRLRLGSSPRGPPPTG